MKLTKEQRERLADICEIMLDLAEAQREAGIKEAIAWIDFNSQEVVYRNGPFNEVWSSRSDLLGCDISKFAEEMRADLDIKKAKKMEADEIRAKISALEEQVKAIYK